MKKTAIIFVFLLLFLVGCNNSDNNTNNTQVSQNNENFNATRLSSNTSNTLEKKEEQICTFSTKIEQNDPARQKNIKIACQKLTGTIINSGETFSFCDTLGPATPEEGYEKAEIFDSEGNVIMEYGGGKCQISSTLYNAILDVPGFSIVERYPHSNRVYYVEEGKDATVCYGSVDFKFRNDNDFNVKIVSTVSGDTLTVSLFKI